MKNPWSIIVLAGLSLGLAACSSTSSSNSTTSSTSTKAGAPCDSSQIETTSLGGGAGAGNVDQVFGFTNVGKVACTLTGYPRVVALTAQGAQVAQAVQQLSGIGGVRTGATTPPIVTLKPGQTASATLSGTDIPTGGATACPPGYPTLLVTPPHMTQPVRVAAVDRPGFPGCSAIRVNPVVPGKTGQLPVGPSEVPTAISPGGTPTQTAVP